MTERHFTQKYTIVQFFDDIAEGYKYSSDDWPLHSTVVDTFAIDWSTAEMFSRLEAARRFALRQVMISYSVRIRCL